MCSVVTVKPEKRAPLNSFVQAIISYLPVAVFPAAFSIFGGMVFTRIFSPEVYGIYSLALAVTVPTLTFLTEWVAQPAGRFYSEYDQNGKGNLFLQTVALLVWVSFSIITICSLLFILSLWTIQAHIPNYLVVTGSIVSMLAFSFLTILQPVLAASFQSKTYRFIIIANTGMATLIPLLLIFLLGKHIAWLLWGNAISSLILIPYILSKTGIPFNHSIFQTTTEQKALINRFLIYGIPMAFWFFVMQLLNLGDRLVIQVFRSSSEIGIYSVNYNLVSSAIGLINSPVGIAIGPILFKQWRSGAYEKAEVTLSKMTNVYFLLAFACLGSLMAISKPLTNILLGEQFRPGVIIFIPVALGRIIWGAAMIGQKSLELSERTNSILRIALLSLLLNVVLNFLLIPVHGYIAAAFTTIASNLLYAFFIWNKSRSCVAWKIEPKKVLPYCIAACVAFFITNGVNTSVGNDLGSILLKGSLYIILYGLIIFALLGKDLKKLLLVESQS